MKIKDIDFGKIDANNEYLDKGGDKYLESFYDYDKYHIPEFISGKRYYICGNKGTGKTALLKYLEAEFKKKSENLVYSIRFKSDIDSVDRQDLHKGRGNGFINSDDEGVDLENAKYTDKYVGIWQVFLISFLGYDQIDLTGLMLIHKPLRNFFAVKSRSVKERAL